MKSIAPAVLVVFLLAGCGQVTGQAAAPKANSVLAKAAATDKGIFTGLKITKAFHQDTIYECLYGKLKDGRALSMNNVDGMYADIGDDTDLIADKKLGKQLAAALELAAAAEKNAVRKECILHLATDLRASFE